MAVNQDPDSIRPPAGELLGQDGNLFFIPETKGRRRGVPGATSGEMSFLWNSQSNAAFVLSEPMQAYAPAPPNTASNVFSVWSTDGPNQFPIKVRAANDSSTVTLVFSKISFKPLPTDRFAIPDGFTRYAGVEAMMAEMMARQSSMMPRRMDGPPGRMPGGPPPGGRPP